MDVVHDNDEIYSVADRKFSGNRQATIVVASCEKGRGPPETNMRKWPPKVKQVVRAKSKLMVEMYVYPGQRVHYQPVGKGGARTGNVSGKGWYLTKGEALDVVKYHEDTQLLEVICPNLKGKPKAWIAHEAVWVDLGNPYGVVKLVAPPYRSVYEAAAVQCR
jgi:hypothetical protein